MLDLPNLRHAVAACVFRSPEAWQAFTASEGYASALSPGAKADLDSRRTTERHLYCGFHADHRLAAELFAPPTLKPRPKPKAAKPRPTTASQRAEALLRRMLRLEQRTTALVDDAAEEEVTASGGGNGASRGGNGAVGVEHGGARASGGGGGDDSDDDYDSDDYGSDDDGEAGLGALEVDDVALAGPHFQAQLVEAAGAPAEEEEEEEEGDEGNVSADA